MNVTRQPHKRLKLAGDDRSKGNGVLAPWRARTFVHYSCAGRRVARSLSGSVRHHGVRMRALLSPADLRAFVPVLCDLFAHVESVRASAPSGLSIKRLQVPSAVSESIVAHVLNSGELGVKLTVTTSQSGGDLEAQTATGVPARLEVKATTEAAFQQFGEKDIASDVLVWLHFDDFFWNPSQDLVSVYLLATPRKVIPVPTKLGLDQLLHRAEKAGHKVLSTTVDLVKLLGLQPRTTATARP